MTKPCDCTMDKIDTKGMSDGKIYEAVSRRAAPEAHAKIDALIARLRDADQARAVRRIARVNRLLLELGYPGDVAGALEELQRLRRNEFICIKCGLRKDGEHDRPADF